MKRKLSLLMVLMMVLTLVPVIPSSALGYDVKFTRVADDMVVGSFTGGHQLKADGTPYRDAQNKLIPAYDKNRAPMLVVDFPWTPQGYDITTPGRFSVKVDPDTASFLPGYNGYRDEATGSMVVPAPNPAVGLEIKRVNPYTLEVFVDPALIQSTPGQVQVIGGQNHIILEIPFFIRAEGYGEVKAEVNVQTATGFPMIKTTKIASVHRSSSTAVVDRVGNLARNNRIVESSSHIGRIKIVENTLLAWRNAKEKYLEIKLDDGSFTFYDASARLWERNVANANDAIELIDNRRTVRIDLHKLAANANYLTGSRNQVVLDLPIRVSRGTEVGTEVGVTLSGEVAPSTLVIAKYTDYAVELKAQKVLDVIAGQDIQNKYIAKVVLEETVPGSLLDGRTMNVALTGMKKENDKEVVVKPAAYQRDGVVRLERLRGTADLKIVGSDISTSNPGLVESAKVDKEKTVTENGKTYLRGYSSFDVEINRGSNLPDNSTEDNKLLNRAAKWEVEVPFVVSTDYVGDVFLTFDGAGMNKQSVKIATVKAPVTFEVAKTDGGKLADLVIGKQHQEAPDVTIKEVEAGVLQVADIVRMPAFVNNIDIEQSDNMYGILGTAYKANDVLRWHGAIVDGEFKAVEGDSKIDDVSDKSDYQSRMFWLAKKSTKATTFKLTNVKVTLDRTVPFGPYQVHVDAGNVRARHHFLTDFIASPDYFNVVTPYPQDKEVKTVFTIGEQKYVQTISGVAQEVTMDVAAQISENRTMLPVRYVAEALGAVVNYDNDTRVATFTKDNAVVSLQIDSDVLYANGSPVKLLAKPMNQNGRVLLPLVSIAQAFGLSNGNTEDGVNNDIEWDAAAKTVTLFGMKK